MKSQKCHHAYKMKGETCLLENFNIAKKGKSGTKIFYRIKKLVSDSLTEHKVRGSVWNHIPYDIIFDILIKIYFFFNLFNITLGHEDHIGRLMLTKK